MLKELLFYPKPYRVKIAEIIRNWRNRHFSFPYIYRTIYDDVPWPHYGYCLYHSALLAKSLGHSALTVIEFGVANGRGILNIEQHIKNIRKNIDIEFKVIGFDLETGVPHTTDFRDIAYEGWMGEYKMENKPSLEERLEFSRLIIGDVKETTRSYIEEHAENAPIGCIFFDLDLYTSTMDAFQIFDIASEKTLPRVCCFFDDIHVTNEFIGELAAIREFNEENKSKKLAKPHGLYSIRPIRWIEQIFVFHNFDHPQYNTPVNYRHADFK